MSNWHWVKSKNPWFWVQFARDNEMRTKAAKGVVLPLDNVSRQQSSVRDLYWIYLTLTWLYLLELLQYSIKKPTTPGKFCFLSPPPLISHWLLADSGYFMHFDTNAGEERDTAILESRILYPKRGFQCLQFCLYHSGHESDQLNVWVREYTSANPNGTLRFIEEIKGME